MVSDNNIGLINQICKASGLTGKDLDDLRTRLAGKTESELRSELARVLHMSTPADNMGLQVERTTADKSSQSAISGKQPTKMFNLTEEEAKELSVQMLADNLEEAEAVFRAQHLGAISGTYDNLKNEDDKLKTSNVAKILDYQKAGVTEIIEAKNGKLTKRAYYEENKERLKNMILTRLNVLKTSTGVSFLDSFRGEYSREEMTEIINAYVENLCSNATMAQLKGYQSRFAGTNGLEETKVLGDFVKNAKNFDKTNREEKLQPEGDSLSIKAPDKGIIPQDWDSDEPIGFEEVYKFEHGTEYSQIAIERYARTQVEMQTVVGAYNKKQEFLEFAQNLRKEDLTYDKKAEKLLSGFAEFYALSEDGGLSQLQKVIDKSKLPVMITDGKLDLSAFASDAAKSRALDSLLKIAEQEKEKDFQAFLGDKSFEEYQRAYEESANAVLGEENCKMLSEAMLEDNSGMIKRYSGQATTAGMVAIVAGAALTLMAPPAGLTVSLPLIGGGNFVALSGMVGKNVFGGIDIISKDELAEGELSDFLKEAGMDAGGMLVGGVASKLGMKAFSKYIDKSLVEAFGNEINAGNRAQALKMVFSNPEHLKNFAKAASAKVGTDILVSYAGDLAMMGVLDTNDDWKSLLQANLMGGLLGMAGDVKDLARAGKVRVKPHNTTDVKHSANKPSPEVETAPRQGGQVVPAGNATETRLIRQAKSENPAEVVAKKITSKVSDTTVDTGMRLNTPESLDAELEAALTHPDYPQENLEALTSVIDGSLQQKLSAHYQKLEEMFATSAKIHSLEINKLERECQGDTQKFAEGIIKILAKDFGLEGFEPPIKIITVEDVNNCADGYADWANGCILLNKNSAVMNNSKSLTEILVHEFTHMLQYRDVLAQFGEAGVRDIVMNDKSIPTNEKEARIAKILNNPYNKKLLESYKFQKVENGSIQDYLRQVMKDEFSNPVTDTESQKYIDQIIEREAYRLGSQSFGENVDFESVHNDAGLANFRAALKAKLLSGIKITIDNKLSSTTPQNTSSAKFFVNETFVTFDRNLPAARIAVPEGHMSISAYAAENNIPIAMMKKYVENGRFIVDEKTGTIDLENPVNKAFLEELNSPTLFTKEELGELLGIKPLLLSAFVRSGELVKHISNGYDLNDPKNIDFLKARGVFYIAQQKIQKRKNSRNEGDSTTEEVAAQAQSPNPDIQLKPASKPQSTQQARVETQSEAAPTQKVESSQEVETPQRESRPNKTSTDTDTSVYFHKYNDVAGTETKTETKIKEYIEVLKRPETQELYNELVRVYNLCCGKNRNTDAAEHLLLQLEMFNDKNGDINEKELLENTDLVQELVNTFKTDFVKYCSSDVREVSDYFATHDEFRELTQEIGFPQLGYINDNNVDEAMFLKAIYEINSNNLKSSLNFLKKNFKNEIYYLAQMYKNLPDNEAKTNFIELLKDKKNVNTLNSQLKVFKEWQLEVSKTLPLSYPQYAHMRNIMNLKPEHIQKDGKNIFSVFGCENFEQFNDFVKNTVPADKVDLMFKLFKVQDIAALDKYLKDNKIKAFSIKYSTVKNAEAALNNKNPNYEISLEYNIYAQPRDTEKHFAQICQLFENINGKITQQGWNGFQDIAVTPNTVIDEIKSKIGSYKPDKDKETGQTNNKKNDDSTRVFYDGGYTNIFKFLQIKTDKTTLHAVNAELEVLKPVNDTDATEQAEVQPNSANETTSVTEEKPQKAKISQKLDEEAMKKILKERERRFNILLTVLKGDAFGNSVTGIHGKMRFIERLILQDTIDMRLSDEEIVDALNASIRNHIKNINSQLNLKYEVDIYENPKKKEIIAPKITVEYNNTSLAITLDDKHEIHTLYRN